MKKLVLLTQAVFLALAQSGTDAASEIRAAREKSNHALAAHDIKALADGLAPDYVMVRGNGTFTPSRQAYLDRFAEDFKDPESILYERFTDKVDISSAAPLAAEHGHWTATRANGKRAYAGTYLAMWRQIGTAWKLRSELFVVLTCDDDAACAAYRK